MSKKKSPLLSVEDHWQTAMGGAVLGQERVVVRGKDLFTELDKYSWQQFLLFMITGRKFDTKWVECLERLLAICINYPDPRIWNNRVAALAGTVGSTATLATSAGMAATEAKIFGGQSNLSASQFIHSALLSVQAGEDLEQIVRAELKKNRAVSGYGRPVLKRDERIIHAERVLREFDIAHGAHAQLACQVEQILMTGRWHYQMNINGLMAAVTADFGLSAEEYYLWLVNGYNAGIVACFIDAKQKPAGALFPLRCTRINYNGAGERVWVK